MRPGVPRSVQTRNKVHACMAPRWNYREEDGFAHPDGKRPRKGALFGGARLTIEPGSDFPIGVIPPDSGGASSSRTGAPPRRAARGPDTRRAARGGCQAPVTALSPSPSGLSFSRHLVSKTIVG